MMIKIQLDNLISECYQMDKRGSESEKYVNYTKPSSRLRLYDDWADFDFLKLSDDIVTKTVFD